MGLILAATAPVLFFLFFIYQKDTVKEPISLLMKCLFGGIVSIAFALVLDAQIAHFKVFFNTPVLKTFYEAFLTAAIPEEISKFVVLYYLIWKSKEFDQRFDGIVYAVFVSLGFALVENIMYVLEGGFKVATLRAVLSVPGHGFFGVLMGYYFSNARFNPSSDTTRNILRSLYIPILFHGLYDYIIFYLKNVIDSPLLLLGLVIFFGILVVMLWRLGLKKIKLLRERDREELTRMDENPDDTSQEVYP